MVEYATVAWSLWPHTKKNIDGIEFVQRRAERLLTTITAAIVAFHQCLLI